MAADRDAFVAHCLELLAGLGSARSRRMFGGHGLYLDDVFVAIVVDGVLFLKADVETRADFEAAGCRPFVYDRQRQAVALGYWSAPEDATDSAMAMAPWARRALAAAIRARAARPQRATRGVATRKRREAP